MGTIVPSTRGCVTESIFSGCPCPTCGSTPPAPPRLIEIPKYHPWSIRDRTSVFQYVSSLGSEDLEWLLGLFVDEKLNLLAVVTLAVGDETSVESDIPELIFRALSLRAKAFMLVHNHPSGDARPSSSDRQLTRHLRFLAEQMGLRLLDHLIVAGDQMVSVDDLFISRDRIDD